MPGTVLCRDGTLQMTRIDVRAFARGALDELATGMDPVRHAAIDRDPDSQLIVRRGAAR